MLIILLIISLTALAGYCNGIMDKIKLLQLDKESWKNKYKLDEFKNPIAYTEAWYYFGLYHPKYKEKFPLSTSILVFVTDKWHLSKWLMLLCLQTAIMLPIAYYEKLEWYYIILGVFFLKFVFGVFFSFKYDYEKEV